MNLAILLLSFIIGNLGAWSVSRLGHKVGLIDLPNERSSHAGSVPKGGGVGILASFILVSLAWRIPWFAWVPASAISLFSLLGDAREISFQSRLALQAVAAATVIILGRSAIPLIGHLGLSTLLVVPIGILMVCGSANVYNFMDGIDGIAAISGFVFACFLLRFSRSAIEGLVLAFVLFSFFMDELNTMIARIRDGEKLTSPHRRHIYQILANQRGLPHYRISLSYGLVQCLVSVSIYLLAKEDLLVAMGFGILCCAIAYAGAQAIRRRWERVPD
jgi:Fuc2NAc and GlcNAc transferase